MTPISRFVPASAGLYVHVTELGEVNEALHRVNAWRWLAYAFDASQDGEMPDDLLQGMARVLGASGQAAGRDLRNAEVGIAASSLTGLDQGVWFVRLPDADATSRWFPADERTAQADFGVARSFRTRDGIIACERDGILALARWLKGDSVALTTMYLMRGRSEPVLHDLPLLQRARGYLPSKPLATVYVPGRATGDGDPEGATDGRATPGDNVQPQSNEEFVAALYEAENGLDVAIRGGTDAAVRPPAIAPAVVERLLQLPRSTLFAAAMGVDWPAIETYKPAHPTADWLSRYVSYLFRPDAPDGDLANAFEGVGASVIVAWDQDFRGGTTTPQLAFLLPTDSSTALTSTMRHAAQRLINLIRILNAEETTAALRVEESIHLGTPISCTPFRPYVGASRHVFARLLAEVELCWAHSGDWFTVTLSRDHMQRLLDAEKGLAPSLGSMREVSTLRSRRANLQFVALAQGGLAAGVLNEWLDNAEAGRSLWAQDLWKDLSQGRGQQRKRIGIGIRAEGTAGLVLIGRVYAGTAADGLLEVGDRIIGVDGALLAMDDPNGDLRTRLGRSAARPGPTIRILRGDELKDVVLPLDTGDEPANVPVMPPAEAIREIASLIRPLPFASIVVGAADDEHYSARLSLRFAPEGTSAQIPPE